MTTARKNRVSDGFRTRDNWSHNPPVTTESLTNPAEDRDTRGHKVQHLDGQSGPGPDIQPGDFVVFSESVANPHALVYRVATVGERVTAVTPLGGSITAPAARFAVVPTPERWDKEHRQERCRIVLAWVRRMRGRRNRP